MGEHGELPVVAFTHPPKGDVERAGESDEIAQRVERDGFVVRPRQPGIG